MTKLETFIDSNGLFVFTVRTPDKWARVRGTAWHAFLWSLQWCFIVKPRSWFTGRLNFKFRGVSVEGGFNV